MLTFPVGLDLIDEMAEHMIRVKALSITMSLTHTTKTDYLRRDDNLEQSVRCGSSVTALCSEGSMFRKYLFKRLYAQKALYSEGPMFRRFHAQKVLYSEGPMFRRSYVQKKIVQKVLYSEGSMFRRSYIQIYSEGPIFRKFFVLRRKNLHLSVSGKLQCKITNHRLSF